MDAGQQMAMDLAERPRAPRPREPQQAAAPLPERAPRRRITRDDVMTAAEVAAMLAMPKSTIYELARRGELPCARLGRTIRFLRDDVEARLRGA
jgi:excisionase family DNA binding protein